MLDAEITIDEKILSALLNHRECVVSAKEVDNIVPEYFETDKFKAIYRNIMRFFTVYKGKTMCTPELMKVEMEKQRKSSIDIARVYALYNSIKEINTPSNDYAFLVQQLKERWYKKLLKQSVSKANVLCNKQDSPVEAAYELLKTSSHIKMLSSEDRVLRTTLGERANDIKDKYIFAKENKNQAMGLYTGFYKLDELTWGIQPGELMIVAGPVGGGKSITMMAMAAYINNGIRYCHCGFQLYKHSSICPSCGSDVSTEDNVYFIGPKHVAYVSIEMPEEDCYRRFLSSSLGIKSQNIKRGSLTQSEEKELFEFLEYKKKDKSAQFHMIDVPRGVDVDFIDAELDRIEATNNITLDVVFIDYMQLMTPRGGTSISGDQDWRKQGAIAAEIHELARNRRLSVISAAQTTSVRSLKNEQMRYGTHRIARAEDIAANANIIIQIEDVLEEERRDETEADEDSLAITYHVIKNRDGAKGIIRMQKDFSRAQIVHVVEYSYEKME